MGEFLTPEGWRDDQVLEDYTPGSSDRLHPTPEGSYEGKSTSGYDQDRVVEFDDEEGRD